MALAQCSASLPDGAISAEIGSFLGGSAVLLAGARKLRGSGQVHCVDPFDASGDAFSFAIYQAIGRSLNGSLRQVFDWNIQHNGLDRWVQVHQGHADEVAVNWISPIDMLFLDGDQSYEGVQLAYHSWSPYLKMGGIIVVHNSAPGTYHEGHVGHRRLVVETIQPPQYADVTGIGTTTFARKMLEG